MTARVEHGCSMEMLLGSSLRTKGSAYAEVACGDGAHGSVVLTASAKEAYRRGGGSASREEKKIGDDEGI